MSKTQRDPDVKPSWADYAKDVDSRKDIEQDESAAAGVVEPATKPVDEDTQ